MEVANCDHHFCRTSSFSIAIHFMSNAGKLILVDRIEPLIQTIRGHKVLLDSDLARLYGVPTKRLNEQVRRNRERFPEDFMFHLDDDEADCLRSQIATLKRGRGQHRKYRPYVFTEHGAMMAANLLNSPQAVEVSVFVVRAFVKLRQWMASQKQLSEKLDELDRKVAGHDEAIRQLVAAMRQLMSPPPATRKRPIGFHAVVSDEKPASKAKARRKSSRTLA